MKISPTNCRGLIALRLVRRWSLGHQDDQRLVIHQLVAQVEGGLGAHEGNV